MFEAKRPVLLLPGALMGADLESKIRQYGRDWRIAKNIKVVSYDALSRVGGEKLLEGADMLICDEGHRLKNPKAACTRKVSQFMAAKPDTIFVALSGTFRTHSMIKDCSHIAGWCLKDRSPFPHHRMAVFEWAEALDQKIVGFRRDPGILRNLTSITMTAQESFKQRMLETEGIIVAGGEDVGASIRISAIPYNVSATTEKHFERLRTLAERPDGYALGEASSVWAVARQLSLGMHYYWDPWAPQEWLDARKAWAKYAREILGRNLPGLESELAVVNWTLGGHGHGKELLQDWRRIQPTFDINSKAAWHDDTALDLAAKWGKDNKAGIVWVEHRFFGRELSKRTGWPYYGASGLDPNGNSITDTKAKLIIASMDANKTGRNLQDRWSRNLVTSPEGLNKDWDQMMGRTHRLGQEADEVTFDVFLGCVEHDNAMKQAMESARAEKAIMGGHQKLLLADFMWPDSLPEEGAQWRK